MSHGRLLIFLLLLIASLSPLLFLNLDKAGQLASALALPLAVILVALPSIPPLRRSSVPWRKVSIIAAVIVAVVGGSGVVYAIWQGNRDIDVTFPTDGGDPTWKDGYYTVLPVPGAPPERERITVAASLKNTNKTGDCEQTATLEYTPLIDGRPQTSTSVPPGQSVELSLAGTTRKAEVKITLHYESGNANCAVDLFIDKAVLHG
ncbi:MAG TPA: hypothetical protein VM677_33435 [Actinokineospora sp.]|nr:hypothetical protein [Actinokineospora sp.]